MLIRKKERCVVSLHFLETEAEWPSELFNVIQFISELEREFTNIGTQVSFIIYCQKENLFCFAFPLEELEWFFPSDLKVS
jgi:hypothetical protein